ncbi:unnamed protein product [Symbiodinium sp. CCMP2456]|nr:unnamed protein product [Symbiodinium sp. CCMP2456]
MYFELKKGEADAASICDFDGAGVVTALPGRLDCMAVKISAGTTSSTTAAAPDPGQPKDGKGGSVLADKLWWFLAAAALILGIILFVCSRTGQPNDSRSSRTVERDTQQEFEMVTSMARA